jgi:predicted O-methyltransferase YrrM
MKRALQSAVRWAARAPVLAAPRRVIARVSEFVIRDDHGTIVYYRERERAHAFDLAWRIRVSDEHMLYGISANEACQLYMAVARTAKVPGDLAEVGVYRGGSATLICEAKGDRPLHLFDTFGGLPETQAIDWDANTATPYRPGQFAAGREQVERALAGYRNVHIHQGVFPGTAAAVADRRFSFVHLDVDTFASTTACLEFFHPRLSPGAVLISHDYANAAGVRRAFDDFYAARPEPVLELSGTQCLVVKL